MPQTMTEPLTCPYCKSSGAKFVEVRAPITNSSCIMCSCFQQVAEVEHEDSAPWKLRVFHGIIIQHADDWHEDDGNRLFFYFAAFGEPPEVFCGTPLDSDYDEKFCYFARNGINLNDIHEQCEHLDLLK